jgi:hypothetical protein
MTEKQRTIKGILGEILSQLLNVPVLSGALATYLYFRLPAGETNALPGYLWTMLFLCIIPLCSLFFYIPKKNEEKQQTFHRQRVASFVFMIVSYPLGWLILALTQAPRIFTATAATYTFVTVGLIFFNLLLHYKASGHAAGVSVVTAVGHLGALSRQRTQLLANRGGRHHVWADCHQCSLGLRVCPVHRDGTLKCVCEIKST